MYENFHPRCRHVMTQWIEELKDPQELQEMKRRSNRSFEIGGKGWIKEQTQRAKASLGAYRNEQDRQRRLYENRTQYQRYQAVLGDNAPKSFSGFLRKKAANGESWKYMQLDYRRRNKLLEHPELALPNAENATANERKFTQYLFSMDNKDGLVKGRALSSRLGYTINNWEELRQEILQNASAYPAKEGAEDQYGKSYTQYMVLYGKKGKPANVLIAWEVKEKDTWLTSAYIKEVKKIEKIKQYDSVILKDGRRGAVVEIYGDQDVFDVDIGSSPKDWDTIKVKREDIAEVIHYY